MKVKIVLKVYPSPEISKSRHSSGCSQRGRLCVSCVRASCPTARRTRPSLRNTWGRTTPPSLAWSICWPDVGWRRRSGGQSTRLLERRRSEMLTPTWPLKYSSRRPHWRRWSLRLNMTLKMGGDKSSKRKSRKILINAISVWNPSQSRRTSWNMSLEDIQLGNKQRKTKSQRISGRRPEVWKLLEVFKIKRTKLSAGRKNLPILEGSSRIFPRVKGSPVESVVKSLELRTWRSSTTRMSMSRDTSPAREVVVRYSPPRTRWAPTGLDTAIPGTRTECQCS